MVDIESGRGNGFWPGSESLAMQSLQEPCIIPLYPQYKTCECGEEGDGVLSLPHWQREYCKNSVVYSILICNMYVVQPMQAKTLFQMSCTIWHHITFLNFTKNFLKWDGTSRKWAGWIEDLTPPPLPTLLPSLSTIKVYVPLGHAVRA